MELVAETVQKLRDKLITVNIKQLDKQPGCLICQGLGWIQDIGSAGWKRCECLIFKMQNRRFELLLKAANMEHLQAMTFENYNPQTGKQRQAYEEILKAHGSYYLYGPWGVGKTHLMAASVIKAIKNNIPAVLISAPRLLDVIRKSGRGNEDNSSLEKIAYKLPYLCLDDIGKQKDSDWTEERLFMLIDERDKLGKTGQCHTSFTSQFPLDLLKQRMDGAIISRIKGMCRVLFVDGEDIRGKT